MKIKNIEQEGNLLILTNLPAFYKVNLFNELAKRRSVRIIFFQRYSPERGSEFYGDPQKMNFEHFYLSDYSFLYRYYLLIKILLTGTYSQMIAGGWDSFYYWLAVFLSDKNKNALINESSSLESSFTGFKGKIKRLFISRIRRAYLPGYAHARLMDQLQFKGEKIITRGVGLFRYDSRDKCSKNKQTEVNRFLYVGRFAEEKNLDFLVRTFNRLPHLTLTLIGYGPLEPALREIAQSNIRFEGRIENKELGEHYRKHDVFILPSLSEPWGLVVEEALHQGLPVLLSTQVGCADTILESDKYGYTFDPHDSSDLVRCIDKIRDSDNYIELISQIAQLDFEEVGRKQVESYIIHREP